MKKVWNLVFVPALLACALGLMFLGMRQFYRGAYPVRYREAVTASAEEFGLDPALVAAVIRTESSFCPDAKSSVGALGLMQLTPDTLYWVRYRLGEEGAAAPELLLDPEENIRYGCANLSLLLGEFGSVNNALAAYHAGWGNVSRWLANKEYSSDGERLDVIPFSDTDSYVSKVLATRECYQRLYPQLKG